MTLLSSFLIPLSTPRRDLCSRDTRDCHSHIGDQLLGLGMLLEDIFDIPNQQVSEHRAEKTNKDLSEVRNDKDKFQVMLDVSQFRPEDLSVKTVDNFIVVQGKHEERQDQHGFVQREFVRRYALPNEVEPENIVSSLSKDGYLTVEARKKVPETLATNERKVPITMSSSPVANAKQADADTIIDESTDKK